MTPEQFIKKWHASKLGEDRNGGGARQHFLDLCELLDEKKPAEADPNGDWYCFERGAARTTGTRGWADVWKRGFFGWEYKGPNADLDKAYAQLKSYADALENPPLLVVSDTKRIIIRTNFTNTVTETYTLELEELADPHKLEILRWVFTDPQRLKPHKTIQAITDEAASKFAKLAFQLRQRGHDPEEVAHFINRLAFCMFAEDVNLLPSGFFTERLYRLVNHPERAVQALQSLFTAMAKPKGMYGDEPIEWFNGGLFDDNRVLPLEREDLALLHSAASMDWQDIDPSIFGTLFERGLDPDKRSQLGAHYTDAEKIKMIVEPVVRQPLLREWEAVLADIQKETKRKTTRKADATKSQAKAVMLRDAFIARLRDYRVLDPACGSGNFLYVALQTLKAIEHRVYLESEALGLPRPVFMETGPHNMLGIELNSYAAELARMTVWIGEIQWNLQHGWAIHRNPILQSLRTIQNHDALLNEDGSEFKWPKADAIIGNPPFLGGKKIKPSLGNEYVAKLRSVYGKRLPDGADFVCYWFLKANEAVTAGNVQRIGLVSTNSISAGQSREILKSIVEDNRIFAAWDDEPWTVDGAAVRVALVCFSPASVEFAISLNGKKVDEIYADLTARIGEGGCDVTQARQLPCNKGVAFQGVVPRSSLNRKDAEKLDLPPASFVLDGASARNMLVQRGNPNGKPNSDVVRPYLVADDITGRGLERFIVNFGEMPETEAALYETPFSYIQPVKIHRSHMAQKEALERWWQFWNPRPKMHKAVKGLSRILVTPRVAKHRIFTWVLPSVTIDSRLNAIARDDDVAFGILQSRIHEIWSIATASWHGVGNDLTYNAQSCFETFPFPKGLEPNRKPSEYDNPHAERIAAAARHLNELRENWLNPPELVDRVPEVVAGYPDRIVPKNAEAAVELKARTLTKLYNERGTGKKAWLDHAHAELDAAVAAAYGWKNRPEDDEVLARFLMLNLETVA